MSDKTEIDRVDARLSLLESRVSQLELAFDEKTALEPLKYHCPLENCTLSFASKDALRNHIEKHELIHKLFLISYDDIALIKELPEGF